MITAAFLLTTWPIIVFWAYLSQTAIQSCILDLFISGVFRYIGNCSLLLIHHLDLMRRDVEGEFITSNSNLLNHHGTLPPALVMTGRTNRSLKRNKNLPSAERSCERKIIRRLAKPLITLAIPPKFKISTKIEDCLILIS